jgi:hypothetical protein
MFPLTLATIDGSSETERLILSLVACEKDGQCLELARETWSENLGWFTQSRVRVAKDEINGLRSALGLTAGTKRRPIETGVPDILRFPSQHSA